MNKKTKKEKEKEKERERERETPRKKTSKRKSTKEINAIAISTPININNNIKSTSLLHSTPSADPLPTPSSTTPLNNSSFSSPFKPSKLQTINQIFTSSSSSSSSSSHPLRSSISFIDKSLLKPTNENENSLFNPKRSTDQKKRKTVLFSPTNQNGNLRSPQSRRIKIVDQNNSPILAKRKFDENSINYSPPPKAIKRQIFDSENEII